MMKLDLLVIIAGFIVVFFQGIEVDAVFCEHWDYDNKFPNKECADGCFAAWFNTSGVVRVQHKNCWSESGGNFKDDCEGIRQIRYNTSPYPIFCACRKNLCNAKLTWVGNNNGDVGTNITPTPEYKRKNDNHLIYIIVAIGGTVLVLVVLFMLYKKKRSNFKPEPEGVSKGSEVKTLITSEELLPPN